LAAEAIVDGMLELQLVLAGEDAREAVNYTDSLTRHLLDENVPGKLTRLKEDQNTMDGGAIIGIVLTAPAVIELAKAVRVWLQVNRSAEIQVKDKSGQILLKNLSPAEFERALKVIGQKTTRS
jgi:hypothetical protein